MHLREGEKTLRVYHHHPVPFVFDLLKVMGGSFPFFFMIFLFREGISGFAFFMANTVVFILFCFMVLYISLIYWLDKLVITNQRIVYVNWKWLTIRTESEAFLNDIQDIQTQEKGIFSYFWFFDYGTFTLDTASSRVTLVFDNAPDPESIRQFVYKIKPQ